MSVTPTEELETAVRNANDKRIESWRDFLDLRVEMAIELGRTRVTAREVLDLGLESIIQLPRSTGEGVDVLAGDHIIAHGEIIMIEDRTGVRINEVIVQEEE